MEKLDRWLHGFLFSLEKLALKFLHKIYEKDMSRKVLIRNIKPCKVISIDKLLIKFI